MKHRFLTIFLIALALTNQNLEAQAQAIFKSWFVDSLNLEKWQKRPLVSFVDDVIGGDWGKDNANGNNMTSVFCIRGADIPDVQMGNKGKMPTRYILSKSYREKCLSDGDLVVEISGGSPTQSTGRCAAISDALLERYDGKIVCTNFCKALKPRKDYGYFLYYIWKYLYDRGVFFGYENGTTGIKNLNLSGALENESFCVPPFELVAEFNKICRDISSIIFANGRESERLTELRDTLLPKLMSGEIDVSEVEI